MIKTNILMAGIGLFFSLISCEQPNQKKEQAQMTDNISWALGFTAPKGYPIEIQGGGYLGDDKHMISAIRNNGILDDGWEGVGAPTQAGGGSEIPTQLKLTWLSLAEKKFWRIDTALPADKMAALFKSSYPDQDRQGNPVEGHYKNLNIGLAPGGVVVLWISGHNSTIELVRFQAKEVDVDVDSAAPVAGAYKNQKEFLEERFKDGIKEQYRQSILKNGIPYGLWDSYRETYNWRFKIQFYKPDAEEERHCIYLNGTEDLLKADNLAAYKTKSLPYRIDFYFKNKLAETEFDGVEMMNVFKTLTHNDKNVQVEILAKIAFQYTGILFVAKAGGKEIPLNKVKVVM